MKVKSVFFALYRRFILRTCGKIAKKYWFCGIFRQFWRVSVGVNMCGCIADCKSWKEKVFVLRDYIYTYMFRLCSGMFGAAAIEKNCILFELYQIMQNWKQIAAVKNRIEKHVFIIENVFCLNVKKLYNITLTA